MALSTIFLEDSLKQFRKYKELVEKSLVQVNDDEFFRRIDDESNSIAIIVKHLAGNMLSRWTDFLKSDGEKPDRNRDLEFIDESGDSRERIIKSLDNGWKWLFEALQPLGPDDLEKVVMIRNEPHTVMQAINRQLTHYAYHIGQIVFLAKHFNEHRWKSLSVPKGKSAEYNRKMRDKSEKSD